MIHQPFNFDQKVIQWAQFLKSLRSFFDGHGYTEVHTQTLVPHGAFEAAIDPLKVTFSGGSAELATSPEIEMKVLLSKFKQPIYQICKSYRDDPATPIHALEFTMLEYYSLNPSYEAIRGSMKRLLQHLGASMIEVKEYSVTERIREVTRIDILRENNAESLRQSLLKNKILSPSPTDTWEDLFFKIMIEKIEPTLDHNVPTLLYDYPTTVSPLSQMSSVGTSQRFEIYWKGMEICNGCVELNDEKILRKNYEMESQTRQREGKSPHPMPTRLFESSQNIPPCAGVAVGLERLFLCLIDKS